MEIVPVVDCAAPAELKQGGAGVTRFVLLLLALLFGGSTDSPSSTAATVFSLSTGFLLVPPLSTVTTVAPNFGLPWCLPVLSFAFVLALLSFDVFAFLAFVTIHGVDFHWYFSH